MLVRPFKIKHINVIILICLNFCHVLRKGLIWITTGDFYSFYKELKNCQQKVKGKANLNSYKNNLRSTISYNEFGHVVLKGKFTEKYAEENTLEFELKSDQSFINLTISELEIMIEMYGDNTGIKNKLNG